MSDTIVIAGAARTPIGKFLGSFSTLTAADLGSQVVAGLLARTEVSPSAVDQVLFGMARQAGAGPNVARQIAIRAGIAETSTAMTVNQACASGLRTILLAAREIRSGDAQVIVAGGVEAMTQNPFLLTDMRLGYRMGHSQVLDANYKDGFFCPLADQLMGLTAETLAELHGISRAEQDAFAVGSQHKAQDAIDAGRFADEIVPVTVARRRGDLVVDADEHPLRDATVERMGKLKPVFKQDGTVHAGNASGVTDGAAAVLVTSEAYAAEHGLPILARLVGDAMAGVDPKIMGIGPVPAMRKLFEKTGLTVDDIDLFELNEAFAAQVIACDRELPVPADKLNVNGGAIALGHPIGCTGTRIVVTLLHELRRRDAKRGLATLCVSGGMGVAAIFERD